MAKKNDLSNLFMKKGGDPSSTEQTETAENTQTRKSRGQGDVVAISIRFSRKGWERVSMFAMSEGTSIQGMAMLGISKLLEEKGLPELDNVTYRPKEKD